MVVSVTKYAQIDIAAPLDHVVTTTTRTDLEAVRFYDPRVVAVETNGLPDGAEGQVMTTRARIFGQEFEIVQTTLVSELPERIVDQTRAADSSYITTVHFEAVDERTTRLRMGITLDSPPGRVFERLAAALTTGRQARKSLARFKEFAELTYDGG